MKRIPIILIIMAAVLGLAHAQEQTEASAPEKKTDTYPLTTCVVSGESLGDMGEPFVITYEGQEVRFCCKGCKKDFLKEPEKYLAKLKAAGSDKGASGGGPKEHAKSASPESGAHEGHEGHSH